MAGGGFGSGTLPFRLDQHVLFLGDVDHGPGGSRRQDVSDFETPLAAHPADGAAREHQAEFVQDRAGARIQRIRRCPQGAPILRMDHGVKLRRGQLRTRRRTLQHRGQPLRESHYVLLEVGLPDAEARHGFRKVEPLDRVAQLSLGADPLDRIARQLGGHARHPQLFRPRFVRVPAVNRKRSQNRIA